MSNETELRDRIEGLIFVKTGCHIYDAEIATQAIIDDLGLTVEHGATHGDGYVHELDGYEEAEQMVRWNPGMHQVERVVGKWEKQ